MALRVPKDQPGRAGLVLWGGWPKEGPMRLLLGVLRLLESLALQIGDRKYEQAFSIMGWSGQVYSRVRVEPGGIVSEG